MMIFNLRKLLVSFLLAVFIIGCSSDDDTSSPGGPLTLGVSVSGQVVLLDAVQYTASISAGSEYLIDLTTNSGDADLVVCDQVDCNGALELTSAEWDLDPDQVTVLSGQSYNGTLYIYVINAALITSRYSLVIN